MYLQDIQNKLAVFGTGPVLKQSFKTLTGKCPGTGMNTGHSCHARTRGSYRGHYGLQGPVKPVLLILESRAWPGQPCG